MEVINNGYVSKKKNEKKQKMDENTKSLPSTSINWYPGHMAKTKRLISEQINLIDIVYEVVDARIPYSSKIIDIDKFIKNKPRIMIMTKVDLCDMKETKKWIKYYEDNGYKVIPIDLINNNSIKKILDITEELMKEKNNLRESKGLIKRKIRVLVVGIPNVGKSTLINKLVGKKVTTTGNIPGVTKNLNWIRINDKLELLDSPGILWPKFENQTIALNLAALTAIKEEILPISNVVCYFIEMLYKYYPDILKNRYNIEKIDEEFIEVFETIGKKRGCLIKGGIVDYDKVCDVVMSDIKNGNIKGITFDRYE